MHVRLPGLSRRLTIAAVITFVLLSGGGIAAYYFTRPQVRVPNGITEAVNFPIYIPKSLPEGFAVDVSSFKNVTGEGEGILIFRANDAAGDSLVFSEQRKPTGFDFSQFGARQLISPKKLPNTPYPTTVGKTLDKKTTLISIVTDTTWVIVTTETEVSNQQLHDIASGISKY